MLDVATPVVDSHAQLKALYVSLLTHQEHFDEFRQLLSLYVVPPQASEEPSDAATVRADLNGRIRRWLGGSFDGLSVVQALQWRGIVIEERFNVSLSPWKEANFY